MGTKSNKNISGVIGAIGAVGGLITAVTPLVEKAIDNAQNKPEHYLLLFQPKV